MQVHRSFSPQSGMTLVEVLLVIFIMGLVAGVAVTTLPERESPQEEAVRELGQSIRTIQDQSVLTGDVLALRTEKGRVSLLRWDGYEWQPAERAFIDLPQAVNVRLSRADERRTRNEDEARMLVFDPLGVIEPIDVTISAGKFERTLRITQDGEVVHDATG
ncbi:prepilin-type N-terminal cleavage/methylation domain-containing protein [Henriciella sp.]|uniref:prepilin-type N-terminal cleavage/methylation domain-containing protein n=1 Tax=Henriciella sp. TaxID=1968823 RepID=UPI00262C5764|nr:prepilin-type N-terminal cleavage/methylation domain-containing protein [Henriciella sp.]